MELTTDLKVCCRNKDFSAVSLAVIADAMNRDSVGGFLEEDAIVANTKPQEAFELARERLNAATAGFGVAVNGFEAGHGDVLRDSADLGLYNGNVTTTREPASKWRRLKHDALGRLTSVVEDPTASIMIGTTTYSNTSTATPELETTYGYDARGNLSSVTQGGRNRSFTYDSLGRLQTAINPESGTTSYGYDSAGNVTSKSDQRGVTASILYDVRGRLKSKTYSGGVATPPVTYCYDGDVTGACATAPTAALPQTKNLLGRQTMVSTSNATTMIGEYDALGRPKSSTQRMVGASGDYGFQYTYNDVGLKTVTYPSGRSVQYGYDSAGRLASANQPGAPLVPYATVESYAPHGAIESLLLGTGAGQEIGRAHV